MEIVPITLETAKRFVSEHHRHHDAPVGHKFSIGLAANGKLIGCAICGRPVSRYLDDGRTCEITRLCVLDGYPNDCSMLYGACCRVAKAMGYREIITYTLVSENGASLKASNFKNQGIAGGKRWTGSRARMHRKEAEEYKQRWSRILA